MGFISAVSIEMLSLGHKAPDTVAVAAHADTDTVTVAAADTLTDTVAVTSSCGFHRLIAIKAKDTIAKN